MLRDGAASQYGSDAIAGVINIQLKKREGGRAQATYGKYVTSLQDVSGVSGVQTGANGQPVVRASDGTFALNETGNDRKARDGETITYAELGRRSGTGLPPRAIGSLMGGNPVPVVIPCHRVVASTGLGGFSGGEPGHELDTTDEDGLAPDRYLLQLWPAAEAPDAVVRQTGEYAAYWHGVARGER